MTNTPMRARTSISKVPGAVIHTNLAEINVRSLGGAKFFVTFIDEATNYFREMHLKRKGDAAYQLKRYVRWSERQTETRVKRIVLNGGKKYLTDAETLESEGIEINKSAAFSPQENDRAERMNRAVKNAMRAMSITCGAPVTYWAECVYEAR